MKYICERVHVQIFCCSLDDYNITANLRVCFEVPGLDLSLGFCIFFHFFMTIVGGSRHENPE